MAFAVGEFELKTLEGPDGRQVQNYLPLGLPAPALTVFDLAPQILDFFSETFGAFPCDSFGITVIAGNLPFRGFSTDTRILMRPTDEQVLAHEIAHQWFGNSVSAVTSNDIWMSEGFATYAALLWTEHSQGSDALAVSLESMYHRLRGRTRPRLPS